MATLAENAAAVKAAQEAIDAAIAAKGGTTAGGLTNAAAAISALPSGGDWVKPADWPDIRQILKADADSANPHGLSASAYRCIMLIWCDANTTISMTTYGNQHAYYEQGQSYIGNGTVVDSKGSITFEEAGYHWMICWGNPWGVSNYGRGGLLPETNLVKWVCGQDGRRNYLGTSSSGFNRSATLSRVENIVIDDYYRIAFVNCLQLDGSVEFEKRITDGGSSGGLIAGCQFLRHVSGEILFNYLPNTSNNTIFANAYNLEDIPDYIGMLSSTADGGFSTLRNLRRLPRVIAPNLVTASAITYSFANSPLISRDSLAVFDAAGNIVDGFAKFDPAPDSSYYMSGMTSDATGAAGARTMSFHAALKNKFTAPAEVPDGTSEQEKIEAAFNAKGWTLAW